MEDPKQKPYFFLPYKDDLSYKDMAEWAFLAAQSLPLTDSRNSSLNFFAIEELSEKGSQLCIAEAIFLFFLRGYWDLNSIVFSPDLLASRLNFASACLYEAWRDEGDRLFFPLHRACCLLPDLVATNFVNRGLEAFIARLKGLDAKVSINPNSFGTIESWLSSKYREELDSLHDRKSLQTIDKEFYPCGVKIRGYMKDWAERLAKREGKSVEAEIESIIIEKVAQISPEDGQQRRGKNF